MSEQTTLETIISEAKTSIQNCEISSELDLLKSKFLGNKGIVSQMIQSIGKMPPEERGSFGKKINSAKTELEDLFFSASENLKKKKLSSLLKDCHVDLSLAKQSSLGSSHPLTQIVEEMSNFFAKLGFSVAQGSEIETEWFCFEALNTPDNHPARDAQDTYYFPKSASFGNISRKKDESFLLRTQTSTVQVRTMLKNQPPIRIIAPGRVFRRDSLDATHSFNFHQLEGLAVDKNISVSDLKTCLDAFVRNFFSKKAEIRLRPSFFPFTEPSFEMDIKLPNFGKLSNKWIELLGCGMVDPEVFNSVGYDSNVFSGFAFGMGIERIAMLVYEIDDIRLFYQNDLRFLKQF